MIFISFHATCGSAAPALALIGIIASYGGVLGLSWIQKRIPTDAGRPHPRHRHVRRARPEAPVDVPRRIHHRELIADDAAERIGLPDRRARAGWVGGAGDQPVRDVSGAVRATCERSAVADGRLVRSSFHSNISTLVNEVSRNILRYVISQDRRLNVYQCRPNIPEQTSCSLRSPTDASIPPRAPAQIGPAAGQPMLSCAGHPWLA